MSREIWRTAGAAAVALLVALALGGGAALAQSPRASAGKRPPWGYQGAPPLIPHDVEARKGLCQDCHATGEQKAPITPHPTRLHVCMQCHLGQSGTLPPFEATRVK